MLQKQKETILSLLKSIEASKNYGESRYWFTYQDFLDPTDPFTDFACENLEGKQGYIDLIENLLRADETAKIYVEVYGYEAHKNEQFIYAETLIIFSKLSLPEIEQIFNEPEDIFPSDIGEETNLSQQYYYITDDNGNRVKRPRQFYIIDKNGEFVPVADSFSDGYSVYYCWWD